MTEMEKITEFAKRKNVIFRIEHETYGIHKVEHTVFAFRNRFSSIFPLTRVSFETTEYEWLLENKKLGDQVNYELAVKLADIKAREELKKDMEFLKTLKEK